MRTISKAILWGMVCWSGALAAQPASCGPVVNTGSSHTVLLIGLDPRLNGTPLPAGSYIIALYEDGNGMQQCGGYVQWTGASTAIAVYGDDFTTPEKDGFSEGEPFRFRVEAPDGSTAGPACVATGYASGGIFSHAGAFAFNGISGLSVFDAVAAECPELCLNIGDYCDDNDENTLNDIITLNCTCAGAPSQYNIRPFAVAGAGDYQEGIIMSSAYSLAWTLGQITGETWDTILMDTCYWLRQGFQQPFEWMPPEPVISCIVPTSGISLPSEVARVYPNPAEGGVTLHFSARFPHYFSLADLGGQRLLAGYSSELQDFIPLGNLPAGMYLLAVADGQGRVKASFKLIKN